MGEHLGLIACRLEREKMSSLCQEFGISRVTGYEMINS